MGTTDRERYTITLDDDPTIRPLIERMTGINSLPFASLGKCLERSSRFLPVAVFVDIHLGANECGLDAVPVLRRRWPTCPIIVITAEEGDQHIGQALAAGANDFLRKPFSRADLIARLHARMAELAERANEDVQVIGNVSYTSKHRLLEVEGQRRYLAPTEALLFEALVQARGMLVAKDELRRRVWGTLKVSDAALDKKIFTLRTVLKELGARLVLLAEYGKGIKLVDRVA